MWIVGSDKELLERKIEKNIKDAYKNNETLRCYNLLKLMIKVNKNNKVLLHYVDKIDDKKLKKNYKKWVKDNNDSFVKRVLRSPSFYISLLALYFAWQFK